MRNVDATTIISFGYPAAADAIISALESGFDPAGDPPRASVDVDNGALLLMPSEVGQAAGLKLLTLAPGNPERGLPKIQGHYLLFDSDTLSPNAMLDGEALTSLRTPALSIAAARPFLSRYAPGGIAGVGEEGPTVAIFGAGPQGVGHAEALTAEMGSLESVTFIVRKPDGASEAAKSAGTVVEGGSREAVRALADAHIIICATGASEALFEAEQVRDNVLVIALGSHLPEAREVPAELLEHATVVVEDRGAALREAGDVIRAIADGAITEGDLISMKDLVDAGVYRGEAPPGSPAGPVVVKTVGMGWQDLAVATAIAQNAKD